jgi:4-hydroxy-tetrahydrodipicolinate synthase
VIERNAGKLPIVVGVGGNCTAAVVEQLKTSDFTGVDAVLSVTPYYNKPNQEGLYQHYKAVAKASPVPVILYNVPGRTGVNMTAETTLRIAREVKNVLGVKEANGCVTQMSKLVKGRPEGFMVISGDDCMTLPLAAIGGDGVISVVANVFPANMTSMYGKALRGDCKGAADEYSRLSEFMSAIFEEGNPTGIKAAAAVKGLMNNVLRLPLVASSAALYDRIKGIVAQENL